MIHPAASGGTEKINVMPGNCSPSHFLKVKLPDQRNRNRLHGIHEGIFSQVGAGEL